MGPYISGSESSKKEGVVAGDWLGRALLMKVFVVAEEVVQFFIFERVPEP